MYNCKSCEKQRTRQKYLKNPRKDAYSKMTEEQKKMKLVWANNYYKTDKGRAISYLKAYQGVDKKKGYLNDLDQAYLIKSFKQPCVYCGFPSNGVDRVCNNMGHSKDNCVPACKECNIARMDNFSHEEMMVLGKTISKIKTSRLHLQT